jgi:hypothetical protein
VPSGELPMLDRAMQKKKTAHVAITNTTTTFEMLSFSSSESSSKNHSLTVGGSWSQQGGAAVNVGYRYTW